MGTAAKGMLGLVLENLSSPGVQVLYKGAISSSNSLTTQPSGSTGMRLLVIIQGNNTAGTVTITGTAPGGSAATETGPTVPIAGVSQSVPVNDWEYLSDNAYATVNASGITTTGFNATGSMTIYGFQASKLLIPSMADFEDNFKQFSAKEQRGLLDEDTHIQQLLKEVKIGKIDQSLYPEDSLFLAYMGISTNPTIATIPASPPSLKASAAISGGPFSLTTQPTAPGMVLIFVVTGSTAVGTIVITGFNQYGIAVNETITAAQGGSNGNGTYYSSNVYSAVSASGVSFTGLTAGSCAITGVYGWQYTFTPDLNALYSAALEWYTGTDSIGVPWAYLDELDFEFGVDKETKVSLKGGGQDFLPIGDRTTNPMSASRVVSLAQPVDAPLVGWQTLAYLDPLSGTPQTTSYADVIDGKVMVKVPQKSIWTATNQQTFTRLYRQQRKVTFDLTIDFVNELQYEQYRQNIKQFLALQFLGQYIGSVGSTVYSKSWTWILPMKYATLKRDASKMANVEAKLTGTSEYEPSVGYSHKLVVTCQQPPTYTL